jgi:phage terminase small subunit
VANEKPLSDRQQAFVAHYLVSRNASDAYRKAGYAAKDANVCGPRLLANVLIAAAVAEGQGKLLEKLSLTADDIVAKLELIATADPTRLTALHIGACRYCWGIEHHCQWRTPREFSEAVELHMLKGEAYCANHPPPEQEGGYGYRQTRRPNPDCPECDGLGRPYVVFADTRDMDPAERELFLGVKQTQHGIEYRLSDKAHALDLLAQRTGVFAKRDENFANALSQAIAEIQNRTSRAPLNLGRR